MNSHRFTWLAVALLMVAFGSGSVGVAQQSGPVIPQGLSPSAMAQISALIAEKESRTPAQLKIDSNLIYESKMQRGQAIAAGIPQLRTGITYERDGRVIVDVRAKVSSGVLAQMRALGANVISAYPAYDSVRLQVGLDRLESIAALPDVRFINRKEEAITQGIVRPPAEPGNQRVSDVSDPAERRRLQRQQVAESVRRAIAEGRVGRQSDRPITNSGVAYSEGDVAHLAAATRIKTGVTGAGVKIGVLSDSVLGLAMAQMSGDLGPVTVLPGQDGTDVPFNAGEGTAMLEIIHDVAPGAQLYFATAFEGISSFAQNIRDLRTAGCDIIVDDVFYFVETPFQDGQVGSTTTNGAVVIQAVKDVTAAGALYFSSAGNDGNKNDGTASNWEGDFVDGGSISAPIPGMGNYHQFPGGFNYDVVTGGSTGVGALYWTDPLGGSGNDYDLFDLDSTGANVEVASTNAQTGTQDPFEFVSTTFVGERLVIVKRIGAAARFLHLSNNRGRLTTSTAGATLGHNSTTAANSFSVAATPAQAPGPYPNPFNGGNSVETFSSDGPRRIFFNQMGAAFTPGDLSSTGGQVLNKPDIAAADGVSVTGAGGSFPTTFYGTSAAAPHAGALAALIKAAHPAYTSAQIRTALVNSAIDIEGIGLDRDAGAGIVMAGDFATYNATYMVPACMTPGAVCDSGDLEVSRDTILGQGEPNQPNTIFSSCADGTSGTFHVNASNDRVRVSTLDGTPFAMGKTVKIESTMWSIGAGTNFVDFYYTATAASPSWTLIGSASTVAGIQTISTTYSMPAGNLQAVRVVERSGGSADPCLAGGFNDRDDLVFAVTPPTSTNFVVNGSFAGSITANNTVPGPETNGLTNWQTFATPDSSYITASAAGGVLQFSRTPPPMGTSNQATVFQETGVAFPGRAPILAQFDLGNTSTVRKYIKVLVIDADFSDFAACTFWLPPSSPLLTYQLKTYTTKAWSNAAIYFYAGTPNAMGDVGVYQVDNVSLQYAPAQMIDRTDCVDPLAPMAPGGGAGPNLLTNGDFGTNTLPPWTTFGTITAQATNGFLEMIRPNSTLPAGVVKQQTSSTSIQAMMPNQILTASFQLGNSTAVRKRVTAIMHDNDFSDLVACVFWLAPGEPLKNYSIVGWASKTWADATVSFYAATIGPEQWTMVDNVTFQRTPGTSTVGSNCIEPAGGPFPANGSGIVASLTQAPNQSAPASAALQALAAASSGRSFAGGRASGSSFAAGAGGSASYALQEVTVPAEPMTLRLEAPVDLSGATAARITFQSRLSARVSGAAVQVSTDSDANWLTVAEVPASDGWAPVDVDLSAYLGQFIDLRLVFDADPADAADADGWRVEDVRVTVSP